MQCPRDQTRLARLETSEGVTVDYCDACSGVWYDEGEFATLFGADAAPHLSGTEPPPDGPGCPSCAARDVERQMTTLPWPDWGDVQVDICAECDGLWLDAGEARAIKRWARENRKSARVEVQEFERDGRRIAVVRALKDETGLNWRWVALGLAIILAAQAVSYGFIVSYEAMGALGNQATMTHRQVAALAALIGFPLGGFAIGRISPGFTLWEPCLAAVPAGALFVLFFHAPFGALTMIGLLVVGFGLTFAGAAFGERRQAN